ncbi:MAG TPA: DUF4157 domain-containing protein [Kofleriaceae bacterium]|nr:DUF4157 domain-containing protein [Kofleriaceae bacterium]
MGIAPAEEAAARPASAGRSPAPGGTAAADPISSLLQEGHEATALDGTARASAEQSLGIDLGGVRVHQGDGAASANHELGARAFAHGQDIVLGDGVANSLNPVMAHELAHVAQQRGAQPGIATKSARGTAGSAHEVEADQAAASIMTGAPAKISQVGAERIMCFEGAEHMDLGNAAYGSKMLTVGQVTLPAGAFTALQGDFFGTWAEMEAACNTNPKLINDYYEVLVREGRLRELHRKDPAKYPEPDSNGAIMVASQLNGRSAMDYLNLAATNFNHFSEQNSESTKMFAGAARDNPAYAAEIGEAGAKFGHNIAQWLQMHLEAGKRAFADGASNRPFAGAAVAMDASALHYLTDAFASGHMRVPRMEMYNEYQRHFRAACRRYVDGWVDKIPNEIDVKSFLTNMASSAVSGARSLLPDGVNAAIDTAGDLANQGANMLGVSMPSLPEMKINLLPTKAAIKAKLYPTCDSLGDTIGEKIAGFSAKVLHDYDNEHGVKVFNDAGMHWEAKGDHALAASKENEKIAGMCGGASAKHIQQLHAKGVERAGKAGAGKPGATGEPMPFISLRPIFSLLPQITKQQREEGTEPGGPRDWHWTTMNAGYRAKIMENGKESIKGTVSSALGAVKDKVKSVVEQKVREALAAFGQFANMLAAKVSEIVDKIMSYIPDIDPEVLLMAMLMV